MTKELKEIISPEGVEEKVLEEHKFQLTQTQGGKFRIYMSGTPGPGPFDTLEEAKDAYCTAIALFGHMRKDPLGTMKTIFKISGDG